MVIEADCKTVNGKITNQIVSDQESYKIRPPQNGKISELMEG